MQILLLAATEIEIFPYLSVQPRDDLLITGVGAPDTIYRLLKKLQQKEYGLVLQAGIAGSFTQSLSLGEVVLIKQDTFGDLGMWENNHFLTLFEKGFTDKNQFPFDNGWLVNNNSIINVPGFSLVKGITVNTVTDDQLRLQQLISVFDPQIETMEGAALHYVCLQEEIPFLQVRAISNYVGERNKDKWKIKEAVENLNKALPGLISQQIRIIKPE